MLKGLIFFIRFFLFWLVFHALSRFIFLFQFHEKIKNHTFIEIISAFWFGLRLDLSITGYLFVIPLFVYIFYELSSKKTIPNTFLKIYNTVFIVLFALINVIDLNIYREWGNKVNIKVFTYLFEFPKEALASSASSPIAPNLIALISLISVTLFINQWIFKFEFKFKSSFWGLKILYALVLLSLTFLCIRGGLGVSPNNQSMAYYSQDQTLNHAAVNTEWNLMSSLIASKKIKKHPYLNLSEQEANQLYNKLYKINQDSTTYILTNKRPNIVLILMESFSAQLTYKYGKLKGVTPHFDQIIQSGYSFDSLYATANRTDKGLIATLAGFPSLAAGSIVKWPEKMQKLPAISQSLKKENYKNLFFYGGGLEFDNYKAFLLSHDYDLLTDKNNFNKKGMNSKWGAYDDLVFKEKLRVLRNQKEPFFSTILTLTNHEPFEVPGKYKFGHDKIENKFKSTAYYTDSVINSFMTAAKKEKWYKNTLFIFIADHGHLYPKNTEEIYEPGRHHIPLVFFGEVLNSKYKGKSYAKIASQTDLAATLLAQLGLKHDQFAFSKNLLNPFIQNFAYYTWDDGFGFISQNRFVAFDNAGKKTIETGNKSTKNDISNSLKQGQALLQKSYQSFLDL